MPGGSDAWGCISQRRGLVLSGSAAYEAGEERNFAFSSPRENGEPGGHLQAIASSPGSSVARVL